MNLRQLSVLLLLGFATFNAAAETKPSAMTMGNGIENWIIVDNATRRGDTFTFTEVNINGNGWLVMHPFENGKPNGTIYVGATYVTSGINNDVEIAVEPTVSSGDHFIVMLHRDVDDDQHFDFVFVGDTGQVEDIAVFEGSMMVGHVYKAP